MYGSLLILECCGRTVDRASCLWAGVKKMEWEEEAIVEHTIGRHQLNWWTKPADDHGGIDQASDASSEVPVAIGELAYALLLLIQDLPKGTPVGVSMVDLALVSAAS